MHRFLEATAGQYMTRTVKTVDRETTMRELERMFEADEFNFVKERARHGTSAAFQRRDEHFSAPSDGA